MNYLKANEQKYFLIIRSECQKYLYLNSNLNLSFLTPRENETTWLLNQNVKVHVSKVLRLARKTTNVKNAISATNARSAMKANKQNKK